MYVIGMNMSKVTLYVVSQNPVFFSDTTCLQWIDPNSIVGDNIAHKTNYCELRAQYAVWKNCIFENEDYIGFFHYRRYLSCRLNITATDKKQRPYTIFKKPDDSFYTLQHVQQVLCDFDVIGPVSEYTGIPVYEHYQYSKAHDVRTLDCIGTIIKKDYPHIFPFYQRYLREEKEYYGNIYIMKWFFFVQYCTFLFDVLEKYDTMMVDVPKYSDGYGAERIFGAYFTWLQSNNVHCGCLPREHFYIYDDERHRFKHQKIVNTILPPGSIGRSMVRRALINWKKGKLL